MLIVSRVSVEFRNKQGLPVLSVGPADLLKMLEAPEEIREDPIFDMLIADNSLEVVTREPQKKRLEADPIADTGADGKRKLQVCCKAPVC